MSEAQLQSTTEPAPVVALGIDLVLAPKISFAAHQSAVPVLRDLRLVNTGDVTATDVLLEIEADPPVIVPRQWRIDRVTPGGEVVVKDRDVQLNASLLLGLSEAMRGTVTLRARSTSGALLAERQMVVELLARTEWGGGASMPELLAAFVLPNDIAVSRLLKMASNVLRRADRPDGIDGYLAGSRERVWELASAIWSAVTSLRLSYAVPPPSFEMQGQKVRSPGTVVEAGLATCLDTALLFASMLEGAGLFPVLVLTRGHAFVGVWLQPQEFATLQVPEAATLRKRIALKELVVFETTAATGATPALFADAIAQGERQIDEDHEAEFILALDIRRARMQRIKPLALTNEALEPQSSGAESLPQSDTLQTAPSLPGFDLAEKESSEPTTPEARLQRWQRKLLDLTTRNRLLNVKPGVNALRLLCPDSAQLEDNLAAGKRLRIVAAPSLAGAAGRDDTLHTLRTGERLDTTYLHDAFARGEVLSPGTQERLDTQLVDLYRKARLDLAEGGANTMFLAIGFLKWRRAGADARVYHAPLILLPVKLERHSARSGVQMSHHEDEARFNPTLLQMLRQDFELNIPELAGPLPIDASGIDVLRVLTIVKKAVLSVAGCEVTDELMLGAFSFAKYLMWEDLQRRSDMLKRNPVVRHLLDTPREHYAAAALPPEPEALDAEVTPADLFMPLPADSSQIAAVVGTARGSDFVLDGPPGTGKSQTIANMIAHNLALGRTVLFVAEKRAALDVVHRRLRANGLGPFCLELHSNKAVKQTVLQQLDSAWSSSRSFPGNEWDRLAGDLKATRDGLNRLASSMNHVHPNGLSLFNAIGLAVHGGRNEVNLGWLPDTHHDAAQMAAMRDACRRLDLNRLAGLAGRGTALAVVGCTEWSNAWQADLLAKCTALGEAASALNAARSSFEAVLGVALGRDGPGLRALAGLASAIGGVHGLDVGCAFTPNAMRALDHAEAALPLVDEYRLEHAALTAPQDATAVRALPVAALEIQWAAAMASVWPLSKMRKAAVAKQLKPEGNADPAADPAADLPRLKRLQALLTQIDQLGSEASVVAGWAGPETETARLRSLIAAAAALRAAMAEAADTPDSLLALREAIRRLCSDGNEMLAPSAAIGRAVRGLVSAQDRFQAALADFERCAATRHPFEAADLALHAHEIAMALPNQAAHLSDWCGWRRACDGAEALGLKPLLAALEADRLSGSVAEAFEHAYAHWWAGAAIDADPVIRGFNRAEHADSIAGFRALDDKLMALSQLVIRSKLSGALPAKDARMPPPGFNALAHELELKRSRKPLRQLIQDMGPALHRLAPCLLMSPLSIAQYLPADGELFDLVIFDEASQIAPWDAVGAIARGRQVVIAGDPKQMPPTSFFDRGQSDGDGDDGATLEDQESILDECVGARLPRRRLTWHYRSRNESLIHFSNTRYYDSSLLTFPAPVTLDTAVSLRRVEGAWARGKDRVNRIEAAAIVAEATRRLLDSGFKDEAGRALTLAIITFNAEQQKLIEDLLDLERRAHPELEPFFEETAAEPVIVRNLETVQGDERDLILLGIGFGPEEVGAPVMAMNFGPLNRQGGERRLNVAITRARRELMVFASFSPTMIDLNRTTAVAVRDLKNFLEYAERGPGSAASAGLPAESTSRFEQAVMNGLRARGWTVAPSIGVSSFRIDLAVVHPDRPAAFLLGVECDGGAYSSAATARDRDKVRDEILRGLGWSLARIWSTDWWRNPAGALERLDAILQERLEQSRAEAAHAVETLSAPVSTSDSPPAPAVVVDPAGSVAPAVETARELDVQAVEPGGDYRCTSFADMAARISDVRFHEPEYTSVIREMITRVLQQEAPIRDDLLLERIARAHNFRRSGARIRDRVLSLARAMGHAQTEAGGQTFVWADLADPDRWDRARYPATVDDVRGLEDVPLPELCACLRSCSADDRPAEAARRFGLRRLSAAGRERLRRAAPPIGHLG